MISTTTPLASLERAFAAIDFTTTNEEIARLDAERTTLRAKAAEADAEAQRLDGEIRDWTGPDPDEIADAIMAGTSVSEAAQAAPSREGLVEKRNALRSTAEALRERAERAGHERDEVARSQCIAIVDAARDFVAATVAEQQRAARAIIEGDAALAALRWCTGVYVPGERASEVARQSVTGPDALLGPVARIPVPAEVVTALKALEGRVKGLRAAVPESVANS